jgi:hypothetical protein
MNFVGGCFFLVSIMFIAFKQGICIFLGLQALALKVDLIQRTYIRYLATQSFGLKMLITLDIEL